MNGPSPARSRENALRTILIAAALAVLPTLAYAASTTSTIDSIRYGINPKRVSVKLTTPHPEDTP
jgi:hypothetical protein